MKKTLIAFAALSAIAGIAQAQSTVTIYGLLDANVGSYKGNVAVGTGATARIDSVKQTKIDSGGLNGSRWGIRVREDLGGGLAAIGNLESGIALDTGASGQGGLLFGRRANVGLTGGFGTVTVGRNSSSYDDVSTDHTMMAGSIFDPTNNNNGVATTGVPTAAVTAANSVALLTKTANSTTSWVGFSTRFNNSVKYVTPNFGGFTGSLMYAFGEDKTTGATGQDASRTISANVKFANGPLVVSGGYQSEQAGTTTTGVANPNTAGREPALENALVSVSYDLGIAKIGAGFNRAKYKDVAAPADLGGGDYKAQKEYSLSVAVPLGATTISAAYGHSKGDTLGKSNGFGVQALYSLSKRTTLYVGGASTKTYDRLAAAVALRAPGSNIGKNTVFAAGVRHTF